MIRFTLVERLALIVQKAPASDLETTTHMFRYVFNIACFKIDLYCPTLRCISCFVTRHEITFVSDLPLGYKAVSKHCSRKGKGERNRSIINYIIYLSPKVGKINV